MAAPHQVYLAEVLLILLWGDEENLRYSFSASLALFAVTHVRKMRSSKNVKLFVSGRSRGMARRQLTVETQADDEEYSSETRDATTMMIVDGEARGEAQEEETAALDSWNHAV